MNEIRVSVERRRGPDKEPYMEEFTVPFERGMSILNVLDYIRRECDTSFSYEASCRRGLCSVCLVKVNGKVIKSCLELAEGDMEIYPGSKNIIKDFVASKRKVKK